MIPPCLTLSKIRYVSRVKWSNPEKGVAPSSTPQCSSYWKGSLLVALDFGHQLYLILSYTSSLKISKNIFMSTTKFQKLLFIRCSLIIILPKWKIKFGLFSTKLNSVLVQDYHRAPIKGQTNYSVSGRLVSPRNPKEGWSPKSQNTFYLCVHTNSFNNISQLSSTWEEHLS